MIIKLFYIISFTVESLENFLLIFYSVELGLIQTQLIQGKKNYPSNDTVKSEKLKSLYALEIRQKG